MTYLTGSPIAALDYNTFATSVTGTNELFADTHSGATLLPAAGLGYGQVALPGVSVGTNVTAAQWNSLFTAMRSSGTHQATSVSPPIPVTGPIIGSNIDAVTTAGSMSSLIALLKTNSFNVDVSQRSVLFGAPFANLASWSTQLDYTFRIDFGSWNNARYYFNTGSAISITATYSAPTTPDEDAWATLFNVHFPVTLNWQKTTQPLWNLILNQPGFYQDPSNPVLYPGLTTLYQPIYRKFAGGGGGSYYYYYATNYAQIDARLANVAGTNGIIDFKITLFDNDTVPVLKPAGKVIYTINRIQSSGAIPYVGGYTYTNLGFVST